MPNQLDIERALLPIVRDTMDALKMLHGVYCEVYRTVAHDTIYKRIELTYTYEPYPYYRGYLLVTGLQPYRHVVNYWWQTDDINVWVPKHNHFLPQANWKLNIVTTDLLTSFRVTDKPVITGFNHVLCYKFPLVPFNEPELKDFI